MSHHSPAMPRQGLKGFRALGLPGVGVQDLQFGVQGATFSTKEMRNLNLGPRCLLTRLVSEGDFNFNLWGYTRDHATLQR